MKKKVTKTNDNIDSTELIMALNDLEKEEGIKKEILLESIENALITAYKKNFESNSDNVRVTMNKETGEVHLYAEFEVVKEPENEKTQISLAKAKEINKKAKVGDIITEELKPRNFGRIAAQTAKQVIVQKIREASRDIIFTEFNEKRGEIVSGIIQKADKNIVVLDLGKVEAVMPVKEQIPTESYFVNKKIRACIAGVEKGLKGNPKITVSRANNDFLRKLFELEIPEIYEGLIEIKSVSRDPGKRCKVAVYSQNENIDPVGSCVGQRGVRIQNIINELSGEKIDVIEWHDDPATYIAEALLPAQVLAVDIKEEEKFAQVIVPDDQLSLAIGKGGQNAKLAAKLTNWKIDIKSESQFREMLLKAQSEAEENESNEEYVEEVVEENPVVEEVETLPVEEEKATKKKTTKKASKKDETEEVVEEVKEKKTTKKKTTKKEDKEEPAKKKAATKKTATKKTAKKEDEKETKKVAKKETKKATKKEDKKEEKAKTTKKATKTTKAAKTTKKKSDKK